MYARVVRFTDVSPDQVAGVAKRIEEGEGPPPGVPAAGIKMLYDESQQTSVAIVFFASEEDMRKGGEALDAMDSAETPGTRVSVDNCEVKAEMDAG
jgi:hypothetical protein